MPHSSVTRLVLLWLTCAACGLSAAASTLDAQPAAAHCGAPVPALQSPPAAAAQRIPDSQAVGGSRNIAWAWLGSPSSHYPHLALGSAVHARSLHALARQPDGTLRPLAFELPAGHVIEDRVPRLADLEGDGGDQIIVVEADPQRGAALVVYGLRLGAAARQPVLAPLARSPSIGTPHRWLNPVGVADFDGDGRPDLAVVTTPHIGGVLTLYRYRPPLLEQAAAAPGFSNHRNGSVEQQLSAIVERPGQRPAVIIPGNDLRTLHALRIEAGQWKSQAGALTLAAPVQRITPLPTGACVLLTDGRTVQVRLGG